MNDGGSGGGVELANGDAYAGTSFAAYVGSKALCSGIMSLSNAIFFMGGMNFGDGCFLMECTCVCCLRGSGAVIFDAAC